MKSLETIAQEQGGGRSGAIRALAHAITAVLSPLQEYSTYEWASDDSGDDIRRACIGACATYADFQGTEEFTEVVTGAHVDQIGK